METGKIVKKNAVQHRLAMPQNRYVSVRDFENRNENAILQNLEQSLGFGKPKPGRFWADPPDLESPATFCKNSIF